MNTYKRSLHLLNYFQHGGAENVALNYCVAMNELNIKSTVLAKRKSSEYEEYILNTASVSYRLSFALLKDADYIFIHSNKRLLQLLFFLWFLKLKKKRIFYIQHLRYTEKKFKILSYFINIICTDFVQITPITSELVKKYIKIDVHFINNFFIPKYSKADYDKIKKEIYQKYQISEDTIIVTFSAVFRKGKGLPDFIELAKYFKSDNRFVFLVIGDGPEADFVKEYNEKNLIWIGFVNDVEKYLIASNVYVFLSTVEMMPMALLEAIYCDNYILAYDTPINNYLLYSHTYASLEDIKKALSVNTLYKETKFFDINYAKDKIGVMLEI